MGAGIKKLREALARGGCAEVGPLIPRLARTFATPADQEAEVREVLRLLRSHRCFPALDELATALAPRASDSLNIFIRRHLAQAKVDCGHVDDALVVLGSLAKDVQSGGTAKDRSEVGGLLGRAHKQLFVIATEDEEDGAPELREAIASHRSVFDLDPSWHGANIIALSARAERDGIQIDSGTAEFWAKRLLQELDDRGRAAWGAWDFAAAGEAYLALEDPERSAAAFRNYWRSTSVDAFALGGTARQLREIWQADLREDPFLKSLLVQLETRLLRRAGGRVEWSSSELGERAAGIDLELSDQERAEALFGANSTLQLKKLLKLIRHAGSICRISDPRNPSRGGTGFLVNGELFGQSPGPLLLTNHHVLHGTEASDKLLRRRDYRGSVPVAHAEAQFTYWGGSGERTFKLDKILDHSIRDDVDFTLASLAGEVPPEMALPICVDEKPLGSRNVVDPWQRSKVLIVGHPQGGELTFSLSDTEVVDHELHGEPCARPRRVHYRTTTDHGNSGSPVFEFDTLEVVGLHRSGRARPLREDWPRKEPDDVYQANEAVWIGSVRGVP